MVRKKIFFVIIFLLFSNNAKASCYDDIEFNWNFIKYKTEIQFEFLNNTNNNIFIGEYGVKTSDNQIIKNNIDIGKNSIAADIITSSTYVSLKKFGRSVKRLRIDDVNSKFIKFGYFKCIYRN